MPIKWTPEIDQILLLKILETSQVHADVKAISAAWPENYETPTPRAITERLVKIRNQSKSNGSTGSFTVSNVRADSNKISPSNNLPRTPRKTPSKVKTGGGKTAAANAAGSGGKRKRAVPEPTTDDSEGEGNDMKSEYTITGDSDNERATPSKRPKIIKMEDDGTYYGHVQHNAYATNTEVDDVNADLVGVDYV